MSFRYNQLESWRIGMRMVRVVERIAREYEERRPASADTLRRASVAIVLKIARGSVPGPRREWRREIDRAERAGRAVRAVLKRLARSEPRDARITAAIELVDRTLEVALREGPAPVRRETGGHPPHD